MKKKSPPRKTKTVKQPPKQKRAKLDPKPSPVAQRVDVDAITRVEYGGLQAAFDHLNRELFDGKLPDAFITYQRQAHSKGYFSDDRFSARSGEFKKPEIALNPDTFIDRSDEQIVSTLAHEMTHLQQYRFGTPSKRGYHNKEWAAMMKAIGLMPSSTGAVDGKETGQRVSHYVIKGGRYARAFAELAASGWKLNLESTIRDGGTRAPPSKVKFTCPKCFSNMWGKPDSKDICGECNKWRRAESYEQQDQQAAE